MSVCVPFFLFFLLGPPRHRLPAYFEFSLILSLSLCVSLFFSGLLPHTFYRTSMRYAVSCVNVLHICTCWTSCLVRRGCLCSGVPDSLSVPLSGCLVLPALLRCVLCSAGCLALLAAGPSALPWVRLVLSALGSALLCLLCCPPSPLACNVIFELV